MRLLASLTNRIFLASALLAVVCIGAAVYVVNRQVTLEAEAGLHRGLEHASELVSQWQASLTENNQLAARLVADAPALKAAVDTGDPLTVQPVARQFQQETRADLLVVTDRRGQLLAQAGRLAPLPPPALVSLSGGDQGPSPQTDERYVAHPDGLLQVASVPVGIGGQTLGGVRLGFLLDRTRALELQRLTDSQIAFAFDGRIVASSLSATDVTSVAREASGAGIWEVTAADNQYVGLSRRLGAGPASHATAILLQSRTERLRFLSRIHSALGLTALLAVLGAVLLSYLVARTVTRPLATITDSMREMAATGDLTRKTVLPAGNWEDEDARLLANTFNTLTDSIATFEREVAQRERLSALGRMSTVIAHEIRNPLMIIKASLRPLRAETPRAEDVQEAAADIAGEVDRLNRIVTEVLDFARPIRFELSPVSLEDVCRQAATAAAVGEIHPQIRVETAPGLPMVTTDAERLRAVLVNLLSNARHAVRALDDSPSEAEQERPLLPAIVLSAQPIGSHRVELRVEDHGVGIPPDHVARIFEPYFTTRRGGTGIGLAISRNIVDGLGGSIRVTSRDGAGTTIRVELPVDSTPHVQPGAGPGLGRS